MYTFIFIYTEFLSKAGYGQINAAVAYVLNISRGAKWLPDVLVEWRAS